MDEPVIVSTANWRSLLFSFNGRISRRLYCRLVACATVLSILLPVAIILLSRLRGDVSDRMDGFGVIIDGVLFLGLGAGIWIGSAITIKRLHDRNRSGWLWLGVVALSLLLHTTPIGIVVNVLAALWLIIETYTLSGTAGGNRYGTNQIDSHGFRLREVRPIRPSWHAFISDLGIIGLALVPVLAIRLILIEPFNISSGSGIPTLLLGDDVMVTRYGLDSVQSLPKRGDVIALQVPEDPSAIFIKRVIGLPNDRVQMIGGQLYLNGNAVPRQSLGDYAYTDDGFPETTARYRETLPDGTSYQILQNGDSGPLDNTPVYTVPAGTVFTLGDNRSNSNDSRVLASFGYIPLENIVGRADCRYFSVDPAVTFLGIPIGLRLPRILTEIR